MLEAKNFHVQQLIFANPFVFCNVVAEQEVNIVLILLDYDYRRRFFVNKANSEGVKCFFEVWLNLIILFQCGIFPPNSGKDKKKKVFAAFWFYLSPEFRISFCQVGITCQKTEGVRHTLPPLVSDTRGRCPPAPPKSSLMTMIIGVCLFFQQ